MNYLIFTLIVLPVVVEELSGVEANAVEDEQEQITRFLASLKDQGEGSEGWFNRTSDSRSVSKRTYYGRSDDWSLGRHTSHETNQRKTIAPTASAPSPAQYETPSAQPSTTPSVGPSYTPSTMPSSFPSQSFSEVPSSLPTTIPSVGQSTAPVLPLSFEPGRFTQNKRSLDGRVVLSNGLSARLIATAGQSVPLDTGGSSVAKFHNDPDGAATFPKSDGGWIYASNAENPNIGNDWQAGGVGAIEFNEDGQVIGCRKINTVTSANCGGGKTPWQSWITCEERSGGGVYQTDPYGGRSPEQTALGRLGMYESFAFDDATPTPTFYVTQDASKGVLTRYTPDAPAMECYRQPTNYARWCTLNSGSIDYLLLSGGNSGSYQWTTIYNDAEDNAKLYYPNAEGIDIKDGILYMTSKTAKRLVILNLRTNQYTYHSTSSGAFDNQPDQIRRIAGDDSGIAFFCEDGGTSPGIFGRKGDNEYFTILFGDIGFTDETTGLAFSPDNMRMYFSIQHIGHIYEVIRDDGRPFDGDLVDIKYHAA